MAPVNEQLSLSVQTLMATEEKPLEHSTSPLDLVRTQIHMGWSRIREQQVLMETFRRDGNSTAMAQAKERLIRLGKEQEEYEKRLQVAWTANRLDQTDEE